MSWVGRISKEAAYTSVSGVRVVFGYENVSKEFDRRTTAFNFPDAEGTYIQDLGTSGRRYPLRVFFWGDDHDLMADKFEGAISERGVGRLEHPFYGKKDVVPFGSILRRDDLKTAANQTIIEVTFWETIGLIYPSSQSDPASNLISAVGDYNEGISSEFSDVVDIDTAVEAVTLKDTYETLLDKTKKGLDKVADTQSDVKEKFDSINESINQGIDTLISQPLNLAFQTVILIQTPARAATNISARLSAYNDLAEAIISGSGAKVHNKFDSRSSNEFRVNDLYASTYVTGSILSCVNNQFSTKAEAVAAAESILSQFESVAAWREDNFKKISEEQTGIPSLNPIDSGTSFRELQEAVAIAAGFLVEISFSLKAERSIVLDRDRTIIDLVAELYGSIDDQLDFFISSNDLSGSEILQLKRGRKIVYYI